MAGELPDVEAALSARAAITLALAQLRQAKSLDDLRRLEARAAKAYWQAWSSVPLTFACRDAGRVPKSWLTFGSRTSPLSGGPRLAITPGCAVLNYLFALGEQEACLALRAVGLDAGLAVLHEDLRARHSGALDLLEAARADIDHFLLSLLRDRTFTAGHFYETRRGSVRILPPLSRDLVLTLPAWAERLAEPAEYLAETLLSGRPTPLTQSRRSAGHAQLRRRQRARKPSSPRLPAACRTCGTQLPTADRAHCDQCLPEVRAEQRTGFAASGPAALARTRSDGNDPAHGGVAAVRRSGTMRQRRREAAEWERQPTEPIDASAFQREKFAYPMAAAPVVSCPAYSCGRLPGSPGERLSV